ncbi:hypothetical protein EB796_017041 [Bugula neritina]|uniref:Uncharacterized protein n=1 Tax=Bugula neritina TaxID=10212 RepID=A0A7J7JGZ7_BUGNE|nr:hypothetical protein EB796_017041 [Bugula neritina]
MILKNTIKNYLELLVLYVLSWIYAVKVKLGILKEKYGIIGFFQVDGLTLSRHINSEELIAAAKVFDSFKPDDVIIGTYPKTGTHFTMGVVCSIYKEKGLVEPNDQMHHMITLEIKLPTILRLLSGNTEAIIR